MALFSKKSESGFGKDFGKKELPQRPEIIKKPRPPVKEAPVSPFKTTQFISPQEFKRRILTSPKAFQEAGSSPSTLKEILDKISKVSDPTSSFTETNIQRAQEKLRYEQQKAQQEGRSKDVYIAGKAWNLLERFRKGEL